MFKTAWYNDTLGDSIDTVTPGSFAGWHTVMLVVSQGQVKYYDGNKLLASHGGKYYPRSKMNLIPQLWFFQNNVDSTWHIDVDWLFYAQNTVLTSSEVETHVDTLRALGVARRDTVQ